VVPQCFFHICRAHGEAFTGKESPSDNDAYIHNTLKSTGLLIEIDGMDEFLVHPQLVLAKLVELSKVPGNRGVGTLPSFVKLAHKACCCVCIFCLLALQQCNVEFAYLTEPVIVMAGDHSGHHACIHTEE